MPPPKQGKPARLQNPQSSPGPRAYHEGMTSYPIEITARHMDITESMRSYVEKKLANIHLKQPRITDAKVVLDVSKHGKSAEIILYCANHTTLEAHTETGNLYEAFDLTMAKILRQMRKEKTRLEKINHGTA